MLKIHKKNIKQKNYSVYTHLHPSSLYEWGLGTHFGPQPLQGVVPRGILEESIYGVYQFMHFHKKYVCKVCMQSSIATPNVLLSFSSPQDSGQWSSMSVTSPQAISKLWSPYRSNR